MPKAIANEIPTQSGPRFGLWSDIRTDFTRISQANPVPIDPCRITSLALLSLSSWWLRPARADLPYHP